MKKEHKIELLKNFETLINDDIYNMARSNWEYLVDCWGSYDERQKYEEKGTLIDQSYSYIDMSEYYTYKEDNYFLYDLGDKYFLEHECYMPGDGTDHWCFLISKGK